MNFGPEALANAYSAHTIEAPAPATQLKDGQFLYLRNENKGFTPASNMKLFTTATALARLGPDFCYETLVCRTGAVDSAGTLRGDLVQDLIVERLAYFSRRP